MGQKRSGMWLLRLVFPGRWGRWLTAATIFLLFAASFLVTGGISTTDPMSVDGAMTEGGPSPGVALFFCVLFAYIIPIHHYIIERSREAFDQLGPHLRQDEEQTQRDRRRFGSKPTRWHVVSLSLGLLAGLAHNLLLLAAGVPLPLLPIIHTVLIWIVMSTAIASLLDNALLFRRLASTVEVNLLNPGRLTAFGSVAVSSTLALIGAQAAFPAMLIDADADAVTFVPGLIATTVPMAFLFLLPVLPLHRRLAEARKGELARLSQEIDRASPAAGEAPDPGELQPLLVLRREVLTVSEWPFDTSVMGRLAIYLIIPPLTWAGAAFIEIMIEQAL